MRFRFQSARKAAGRRSEKGAAAVGSDMLRYVNTCSPLSQALAEGVNSIANATACPITCETEIATEPGTCPRARRPKKPGNPRMRSATETHIATRLRRLDTSSVSVRTRTNANPCPSSAKPAAPLRTYSGHANIDWMTPRARVPNCRTSKDTIDLGLTPAVTMRCMPLLTCPWWSRPRSTRLDSRSNFFHSLRIDP